MIAFALHVILTLLLGAGATGLRETYIATFDHRTTGAALARTVAAHASDPARAWDGHVMHAHETVQALVVLGEDGTCDLLLGIDGVLHCEPDSIVHAI